MGHVSYLSFERANERGLDSMQNDIQILPLPFTIHLGSYLTSLFPQFPQCGMITTHISEGC